MKKLYVVFSEEARNYVEDHGYSKLAKQEKLKRWYDWNLKEFDSQEIMDAYTQGLSDAQGWDVTDYCELTVQNGLLTVENELLKPKYIITHSMGDETVIHNDGELIDFVNDIAIRNEDEAITTKDEAFDYVVSSCENLLIKTIY